MPPETTDTTDAGTETTTSTGAVEKTYSETEVAGIKAAQRRVLDEKKKVDAELDRYRSTLGSRKLEDVAEQLKRLDDAEDAKGTETEKRTKREKALRDEFNATLAPYIAKAERLEQKEYEEQVWAAAKANGALDSDRRLVLKAAKDDYVTRDKDGKIVIVDENGDPTGDDLNTLMSGRFKKENGKLFAADGGSGGGASAGSALGGRGRQANMSMSEFATWAASATTEQLKAMGRGQGSIRVTQ